MHRAGTTIAVSICLLVGACTSSGNQGTSPVDPNASVAPTTTTTSPPILLGTSPNLALPIGECWNELAVASTTTTTEPLSATEPEETTTSSTLPSTTRTTVPKAKVVAVVDCSGTNQGEVYSSFCLGTSEAIEIESSTGAQTADALQKVPCPGDPELTWPGDREIRRAAARVCLETFAIIFGETYAVSDRTSNELTPNEGLWDRGERRVVCSATQPPPPTTSTVD